MHITLTNFFITFIFLSIYNSSVGLSSLRTFQLELNQIIDFYLSIFKSTISMTPWLIIFSKTVLKYWKLVLYPRITPAKVIQNWRCRCEWHCLYPTYQLWLINGSVPIWPTRRLPFGAHSVLRLGSYCLFLILHVVFCTFLYIFLYMALVLKYDFDYTCTFWYQSQFRARLIQLFV